MVTVNIRKLRDDAKVPMYAHPGDAGMDFFAVENTQVKVGETVAVPTGISLEIPNGHVGLVWDKSGMALKHSLHCLAGVVDSGYRGEIKIVVKNLGNHDLSITKHMKVAQMLIQPVVAAQLHEAEELTVSARQNGGFGSTGTH